MSKRPERGDGRSRRDAEPKEFDEKVVSIDRVARVVAGGRRFRFRATVVIGDKKGRVGVAVAKGQEVQSAIQKAVAKAKKAIITVPMVETTIPHETRIEYAGAKILLKPARKGTGVIAGGSVRAVVEAAGLTDVVSKILGSNNKINNVYAAYYALKGLKTFERRASSGAKESSKPAKVKTEAKV